MRRSACKVRCELDDAHAEHRRPHVPVLLKGIKKLSHRDPRRRMQLGQHRQSSLSPQIFVASRNSCSNSELISNTALWLAKRKPSSAYTWRMMILCSRGSGAAKEIGQEAQAIRDGA